MFEIFVSYARIDNAATPGVAKDDGFVTLLWERLQQQLEEMNADVKFWFDQSDIKKSEQFDEKIDEGLKRSDLLLVVLSPNWMKSENCQKELTRFAEHRRREGDTKPKERIVVVSKRFVVDEKRPELLQRQDSYRFYHLEKGQPEEAQLEYFRVAKYSADYMDLLNELARDIAERAHRKGQRPASAAAAAAAPPKTSRGTVYLAKTSGDLQPVYNRLYDEISGSNYEVVPARDADLCDPSVEQTVRAMLDRCRMSIHLLGRYPEQSVIAERGGLPKVISLIRMQLLEAVKGPGGGNGAVTGDFKRLIWAPKVLEDSDGIPYFSNREPNDALRLFQGGDIALPPQDIVDGSEASNFSDIVKQELAKVRLIHQPGAVGKGDKVCILNANEDAPYLSELIDALQALNLDPRVPTQTGTTQEITSSTKKELMKCDAVVVLWGQVHEGRVEKKWSQYLNPEYLSRVRDQELPLRVLVLGPEPRLDKEIRKKARPKDEIDVVADLTADWISLDRLREVFELRGTAE